MTDRLRGVYVVLNQNDATLELARAALASGVRLFQYRAKLGIDVATLQSLRALTLAHDAVLIVNDDWRAAVEYGCDGVHVGPDDEHFGDLGAIRASFRGGIIGASCGTARQARLAQAMGADYVGVGPVFVTSSKADAGEPIGIAGLAHVAAATTLPVAAIGGIDEGNIAAVRASGVAMAAVISAVADASKPEAAARALVASWEGAS